MIITRTPYRISFFGGGTDYPPWYRNFGGQVLSTTIDKYCYISVRHLPQFFEHRYRIVYSSIENTQSIDEILHPSVRCVLSTLNVKDGLEIHHDGDLPARSGLGSSSSFTVGLIHAINSLNGNMSSKLSLARDAINIEQNVIMENVGSQDQVAAAYGGLNRITFNEDDTFEVNPVVMSSANKQSLNNSMLLFFTGISRIASEIAKSKIENISSRYSELTTMKDMVDEAIKIVNAPFFDIFEFGKLLDDSWLFKKSLSTSVTNSKIDSIYQSAIDAGAIGGKLLGAGGGGFIIFVAPLTRHAAIIDALRPLIHVPFSFENGGSKVVLYEPDGLASV